MKRNWLWSDAEDQKLATLIAQGKSMRAIAMALKRTTAAVQTRAYILRTKANPDVSEKQDPNLKSQAHPR
jgi:hypothetical protein